MAEPIRIHPQNSKILEYKGKPTVLVCATEHYGAVMNRPFDMEAYLKDCKDKNQNYTRLFLLFRELQTHDNPYSPCKPESSDYVSPFKRTGPGLACDKLPKYDLEVWNDEFFERLHRFVKLAEENDVIVEVVLFSCSYRQHLFELIPICAQNNINGTEDINFNAALTMKPKKLFEYQKKYVTKVVTELNKYPNFFFEICNEPVWLHPEAATKDEIDAWQFELVKLIRNVEKDMPNKHLVAIEEAVGLPNWDKVVLGELSDYYKSDADIINVHPGMAMYKGRTYSMGEFMHKGLAIEDYIDFCLDTYYGEKKMLNMDEDNVASAYRDYDCWTIHRKRGWTAVMCGAHYDYIDFSIQTALPAGTPESRKHIRTWFKYLQNYIGTMDMLGCKPLRNCVTKTLDHTKACVMGVEGKEYHAYIVDIRDLTDPNYNTAISGKVTLDIADGTYNVTIYSPEFGQSSVAMTVKGGKGTVIDLPAFKHDTVIRFVKA